MIIGGTVLLLPGICVGMFDLRWGQVTVIAAGAMIAYGLSRITTRTLADAQAGIPRAHAVKVILIVGIVASWCIGVALILISLHWVANFNQLGHIRWH
jgi:hypothetical protein